MFNFVPSLHFRSFKDRDLGDEYGWKQVHGDVFRPAAKPLLFSTLLGTGHQLLVVTVAVILFTIFGELYTERGSLLSTAIFVYAATSPINGYFGASIYAQMGGKVFPVYDGQMHMMCFFSNFFLIYFLISEMDSTNVKFCVLLTLDCMWNIILHQLYCNLLSCFSSHSFWQHGK